MRRRVAAGCALVLGAATLVLGIVVAVNQFPRGLGLLVCVLIAGAAAWYGVLRRGFIRAAALGVAGLALLGALALVLVRGASFVDLLVVAGLLLTLIASRAAYAVHVDLPPAPAPDRPGAVLQPPLRWWQGGALRARQGSGRPWHRGDRAAER